VPPRRTKRQPQRTCVGCRDVLPKRALIRIVRGPSGVRIDPTGKAPGRGAYLHDRRPCWAAGLRGTLAQALKAEITPVERQALTAYMDGLTDEQGG
jgi:uncharacterized protein